MSRPHSPEADPDLPFIDEHSAFVAAPAGTVWRCLTTHIRDSRLGSAEVLARGLAAEPRRGSGSPIGEGATLPGFLVVEAVPDHRLQLTGRHRFSRYALTFTLARHTNGTLLSARTDAAFPGLHGHIYRTLVVTSGAHRILVARLLRAVRRQAERQR